jgi:hypothetical protein
LAAKIETAPTKIPNRRENQTAMTATLPDEFDLAAVDEYLRTRVSESNRNSCMKVIARLTSGAGVTHVAKTDGFMTGTRLTPHDDLEAIRQKAAVWLPYQRGNPRCLDKGHGWALNHPIKKLINYKKHLLGIEVKAKKPPTREATEGRKRKRPIEMLQELKSLLDAGVITEDEFAAKKVELLARV